MSVALGCTALLSCQKAPTEETQTTSIPTATAIAPLNPCDPVSIEPSLVVRSQAILGAADFSFQRTIAAIRNTSGGNPTTDAALADTILSGLLTNPFSQPISALPIPAQLRTAEDALSGAGLLTEMRPVALFNRFDLAPDDGSNCGEYRIVYGRYPNSTLNRYLLIFEAVLPNPSGDIQDCQPVQQFWHDLADPALSNAQRATLLANFYYNGIAGFEPVVHFEHYGSPLGQVRSNMFRMQPWQLREWRTALNGSGEPVFVPDTDKDNPLAELYNESSSNPNPSLFASEQLLFRTDFMTARIPALTDAEHVAFASGNPVPTGCNLVNTIGAGFDNRFNEMQGNAQSGVQPDDEPGNVASANFENAITTVIAGDPALAGLTQAHILNRAGTVTCGGCHQFSAGDQISPGTTWPAPAAGGFVHVQEEGSGVAPPALAGLSPALLNCFLPARREVVEEFLCPPVPPDDAGSSDLGVVDTGVPADSGIPADSGVVDAGSPDSGVTSCDFYHPCSQYEYCEFGPYNVCGSAGPGVCQPRPPMCGYGTQVCGCDGQTYNSECEANMAGTDVASQGSCGGSCNGNPPRGCCFEDADCGRGGICVGESCAVGQAGVCKGAPTGKNECWDDAQCGLGEMCEGEIVCGCGHLCRQPDAPGQCVPRTKKTIASARAALLNATDSATARQAQLELEAEIAKAREEDRRKGGAFHRVRRTH